MDTALNTRLAALTLPEDQYLDQDQEILDVFIEELEEVFSALERLIHAWHTTPDDQALLQEICRHFNNLKGTGRMVGANASSEIAWMVEETLTRILNSILPTTLPIQQYVAQVYRLYRDELIEDFKQRQPHRVDLRPYTFIGSQLQLNLEIEPALMTLLMRASQTADELELAPTNSVKLNESIVIFLEEISVYVADIHHFLANSAPSDDDFNRLLRALHTIRGSSSMACIDAIFDASTALESTIKQRLLQHGALLSTEQALLGQYLEFITQAVHNIQHGLEAKTLQPLLNIFLDQYQLYQHQLESTAAYELQLNGGVVAALLALEIDDLLDAEFEFQDRIRHQSVDYIVILQEQAASLYAATDTDRTRVLHIFTQHLQSVYQELIGITSSDFPQSLYDAFQPVHTAFVGLFDSLAAAQHISSFTPYQVLFDQLNQEIKPFKPLDLEEFASQSVTTQHSDISTDSVLNLDMRLMSYLAEDRQLVLAQPLQVDDSLLEIFLEESEELLAGVETELTLWAEAPHNLDILQHLIRFLHTLKGGANMVQLNQIGLIAHELESIYQRLIYQQLDVSFELIKIIRIVHDDLAERIQNLYQHAVEFPVSHVLDVLQHIEDWLSAAFAEADFTQNQVIEQAGLKLDDQMSLGEVLAFNSVPAAFETFPQTLVEKMFMDEAQDLLSQAELNLQQWIKERHQRHLLLELQRIFHRLTRSARLLELKYVMDITTRLEITFERMNLHNSKTSSYDPLLLNAVQWLRLAIFDTRYDHYHELKHQLEQLELTQPLFPVQFEQIAASLSESGAVSPGDGTEPPSMHGEWDTSIAVDESNEMIRVSADLIDKMIDQSGENAINRSRIQMDIAQVDTVLGEMELAIQRLSRQLKHLDRVLDTQSLQQLSGKHTATLEPEQYSNFYHLSKSLAESASDLLDFRTSLTEKIRDTESLLLQQSRIQADLQENLIRTRLVPFSHLLPRLQRTVRQTALALNRPTQLLVHNTEGELDRSILERLVVPLEHMLRNAIDHGIEDQQTRLSQGKPSIGTIELSIRRHGTDVVLQLKDDGRGMDSNAIANKAQQLGYLDHFHTLDDDQIFQYIFYPGFSTASAITHISGRGVGLDIVHNEIKALGGKITVTAQAGMGTTFSLRVPTTVAVSDALMVKVLDQQYALPLGKIERIVRLSPLILEQYFNSQQDRFELDNTRYKLRYLGEFVSNVVEPDWSTITGELEVLLIHSSTGPQVALLVDQVVGSRGQIVVKPIGQQFSQVKVVAGASILGDGQVCLILDPITIAEQVDQQPRQYRHDTDHERAVREERAMIMVVDDSVTVRKVTSRLLERQGYDVVTAKDGQDALEKLEHIRPDVILLDVEMPRMDGFEFTRCLRQYNLLQALPIIMISSRTGEKYREMAQQLEVNDYLGKPFQEEQLLAKIQMLLMQATRQTVL